MIDVSGPKHLLYEDTFDGYTQKNQSNYRVKDLVARSNNELPLTNKL
ncbi:MAG: hypothetical protein ACI88A_002901 [Paraglaciecola sp.]|jgi:hypothetical protein